MAWNSIISTGTEWATVAFATMFAEAWNERAGAASPFLGPVAMPAEGGNARIFWKSLQTNCADAKEYFVRQKKDNVAYSPEMEYGIDSAAEQLNSDGTVTTLNFPWPDGWERRWYREIHTLSAGGTNGQRARFIDKRAGELDYGYLTTDPAFGDPIATSTPDAERQYSGKYFDRTGGAWVLSSDQNSPADTPTETGNQATIYAGDIMGFWICRDIRDAINQLTRVCAHSGRLASGSEAGGAYPGEARVLRLAPVFLSFTEETKDGNFESVDVAVAMAQADSNYAAAAVVPGGQPVGAVKSTGPFSFGNRAQATRGRGKLRVMDSLYFDAWPNPDGLTREISFWGRARKPTTGSAYQFDSYGDSAVTEDRWRKIGGNLTTDAIDTESPDWWGSVPATFIDPYHPDAAAGGTTFRGWNGSGMDYNTAGAGWASHAAIADFSVAGGFTYKA